MVTSGTGPSLEDADVNNFSLDSMVKRLFMQQRAFGHPKLPYGPDVNILVDVLTLIRVTFFIFGAEKCHSLSE